jgi:hypothetical protein
VIDCAGVELMAPSFADELFGKLFEHSRDERTSPRVSLENLAPEVRATARFAVAQRCRSSD